MDMQPLLFILLGSISLAFVLGGLVGFLWQHYRGRHSQLSLHHQMGELQALLQAEKEKNHLKLESFNTVKNTLQNEFSVLSQTILDEKTLKFTHYHSQQLGTLLNPLREQLGDFEKKLRETHQQHTQGALSLTLEIKHLKELNQKISQDALNLTQALKGNNKQQGCWGEMILARVLEKSGLTLGREYEIEVHSQHTDGKTYRPDVIVRLPEGRDIIIDAKVSLTAYLRYQEALEESAQQTALSQHITSLRQHMRTLASKEYQKSVGLNSLDFVLLFFPIEAALSLVLENDTTLFDEALAMNIILVTPTTLLTTLRTVNTLWRIEQQNKNALEIANHAGSLYDKFSGLIIDFDDIGQKLQGAQKAHEAVINKLHTGRGNLIAKVEHLKKLGAKANKQLPQSEDIV